jgi:hypothetical protein
VKRTRAPHGKRSHGLPGTYTWGCRCDACREAHRLYHHTNDSNKVHERVRSLCVDFVRDLHPEQYEAFRRQAWSERTSPDPAL